MTYLFVGLSFIKAQNNPTSSPYSRFGVGEIGSLTFARNISLGGSEIGLNQPGFINYGNPAANSNLSYTTYEIGLGFKQYDFKTDNTSHKAHSASVSYFEFAFPIKPQKWSLGFGLMPYSEVGYSVTSATTNSYNDIELAKYEGSGGLNNFHIGTGFKISKKFSFGVDGEYLFGVINNDRKVEYTSNAYQNSSLSSSTSVGWFHFQGGMQFRLDSLRLSKSDSVKMMEKKIYSMQLSLNILKKQKSGDSIPDMIARKEQLKKEIAEAEMQKQAIQTKRVRGDWHFVLGVIAAPAIDLKARNSTLINSYRYATIGVVLVKDTIIDTRGAESYVRLPFKTGLGFSILKGNQWMFCSDFTYQQWSDFSFLGQSDSLVDSWKYTAGIQFTPNDRAVKSYAQTIQYRVGFHYEHGFLNLKGKNINDMGISFGTGLPIKRAGSMLNFAFEFGKRGTTENYLVLEHYFKFTIGFTVNDRWFVKSKYD